MTALLPETEQHELETQLLFRIDQEAEQNCIFESQVQRVIRCLFGSIMNYLWILGLENEVSLLTSVGWCKTALFGNEKYSSKKHHTDF